MTLPSTSQPGRAQDDYESLAHLFRSMAGATAGQLASGFEDLIGRVFEFDVFSAVVFKNGTHQIEWSAGHAAPELQTSAEAWPILWAHERQQSLMIGDWSHDARFPEFRESLTTAGSMPRSLFAVPLTLPHRQLGALMIASSLPEAYSSETQGLGSVVAVGVSITLDHALRSVSRTEAQPQLEQQNARLQLLLDLSNRVSSNLDLRDLLRATSASIRELIGCDFAAVSLKEDAKNFRVYAQDFPGSKGLIQEQLVVDTSRSPWEKYEPRLFSEIDPARHSPEQYKLLVGEGIESILLIPLVSHERMLGALVLGKREGAAFAEWNADFLMRVGGQIAIAVENALAFREISELKEKLAQEKLYLEEEIRTDSEFHQIVGQSATLRRILELVRTVAPTDSTVLLLGETGTGKELVARAVHEQSRRKDRTFVKLNCAAIPTGLIESELFGHEKGAFTGAIAQRVGRMELADQGTLFLDEVGDIPLDIQPKLLRALQEQEFERLGSTHTRKVNVRLVAATNRDLESMVAAREFRADLYYRLNVFPIRIPPLRERKDDIPLLVSYFVQKYSREMNKSIDSVPTATMRKLASWDWPGNIRELENYIERAVILTRGNSLDAPLAELKPPRTPPAASVPGDTIAREEVARIVKETMAGLVSALPRKDTAEESQKLREQIEQALTQSGGRVGGAEGAAARLGLNRTTLISRIRKLGIDTAKFQP